jgi:hypothetical protein
VVKQDEHQRARVAGLARTFQASGHEVEDGVNLFPRHVELFHHLVNAQVLKILDDRGNGQAGYP